MNRFYSYFLPGILIGLLLVSDVMGIAYLKQKAVPEIPAETEDALVTSLRSMSYMEDLKYFPVPISQSNEKATVSFTNSWMASRTFGGERGHEGCDIMAGMNERGIYPVLSMTDGTIEQVGWLTQGGYRVGIKGESGAYFYYAHLESYTENVAKGNHVTAGEQIGFMGDSGYGREGTTGMFDVHLHVGIYLYDEEGEEYSINPYYALKYLENSKITMEF